MKMVPYDVIILAGGLGTRLRGVVSDVPKCMAPVAGKPFLEYLTDTLRGCSIGRVVFSIGYLGDIVRTWVDSRRWPFETAFAVEDEPLGTGGAVRFALGRCAARKVLLLNGDTIYNVDYDSLVEGSGDAPVHLSLKPMADTGRYGRVETDKDGRVASFREKLSGSHGLINGGVCVLDREKLSFDGLARKFSFEKDVLEPLSAKGVLTASVSDSYFIDIGIAEDYGKAATELPELSATRAMAAALETAAEGMERPRTLILDRDGVINRRIPGDYVRAPEMFEFLPGIPEAVARLSRVFDRILVMSNQRGVGRGLMSMEDLGRIHEKMIHGLEAAGGRIDGIYCATSADPEAPDRKPRTGMFEKALADWPDMAPERTVMAGDSPSDMEFAAACGIKAIKV